MQKLSLNSQFHSYFQMSLIIVFLIFSTIVDPSFAFFTLDFEPDYHPTPCMADNKFHYLDWSELTLVSDPKMKRVYMNGTLKFIKDFGGIIRSELTTERFHNGQWIPGEFKGGQSDVCKQISDPLNQPAIYQIFHRGFKQKGCTFKAGVRSICDESETHYKFA